MAYKRFFSRFRPNPPSYEAIVVLNRGQRQKMAKKCRFNRLVSYMPDYGGYPFYGILVPLLNAMSTSIKLALCTSSITRTWYHIWIPYPNIPSIYVEIQFRSTNLRLPIFMYSLRLKYGKRNLQFSTLLGTCTSNQGWQLSGIRQLPVTHRR